MSQSDTDKALAAEERSQETKSFVRRVRAVTRRRYSPSEKIRMVLEGFRLEVTVNRISIRDALPLKDGDEIGLGNVLFHFHNPMASQPSTRHTIKLPSAVDWYSEHSSLLSLPGSRASSAEEDEEDDASHGDEE